MSRTNYKIYTYPNPFENKYEIAMSGFFFFLCLSLSLSPPTTCDTPFDFRHQIIKPPPRP